jgi:hypothetical protein
MLSWVGVGAGRDVGQGVDVKLWVCRQDKVDLVPGLVWSGLEERASKDVYQGASRAEQVSGASAGRRGA